MMPFSISPAFLVAASYSSRSHHFAVVAHTGQSDGQTNEQNP